MMKKKSPKTKQRYALDNVGIGLYGQCPNCGEILGGDGCTVILHCPYAEKDHATYSPDDNPIYCDFKH